MKLFTKADLANLPKLYAQDGKGDDAMVFVKLFSPFSNWTWYVTEFDPEEKIFFGLADGFEAELGYTSLEELESLTHDRLGIPAVERDKFFTPRPIKEVRREVAARRASTGLTSSDSRAADRPF